MLEHCVDCAVIYKILQSIPPIRVKKSFAVELIQFNITKSQNALFVSHYSQSVKTIHVIENKLQQN